MLQLLTHGLATAGLFLLTGFLAQRRGTTEVAAFGGLAKPMPVCAFFFGVMVLSLMGLPVLGGFVGDLFVLLGSLETRRTLSVFRASRDGGGRLVFTLGTETALFGTRRRAGESWPNRSRSIRAGYSAGDHFTDYRDRGLSNPVLRRVEPAVLELLYQMERRSVVSEESPEARRSGRERRAFWGRSTESGALRVRRSPSLALERGDESGLVAGYRCSVGTRLRSYGCATKRRGDRSTFDGPFGHSAWFGRRSRARGSRHHSRLRRSPFSMEVCWSLIRSAFSDSAMSCSLLGWS